jgi:antitoxin component of RelBE/YafQ-DinJ toxin-antitoxin module
MNTKQVNLSEEVIVKAEARARALGLTLTEYVQALVNQDANTKEYDPWREPIPKEVDERWEKEIAEFDEQEKIKPRPSARTAEELIKLLDEEAAQLPDDEGN